MSPHKKIHNQPAQLGKRRMLRNSLTPAEARLWSFLNGRKLDGRKFRRQHGVGPYILDFYCPEENLAVELDGQSHDGPIAAQRDADRTEYLNARGIRVVRFENSTVFEQPEGLLDCIRSHFGKSGSGMTGK